MADRPFDPETGELIPRFPERGDLVELCRQLQQRGDIEFLRQYFAARGITPPEP
jgi:hypothetical protein